MDGGRTLFVNERERAADDDLDKRPLRDSDNDGCGAE